MSLMVRKYLCLLGLLFGVSTLIGQTEIDTSNSTENLVKIKNSDFYEFRGDLEPPEQHFKGNVKMTHDSIFMFADSSIVTEKRLTSIGEVVILQDDTIRLFSDSLYYDMETKLAKLYYNVVLENGNQQLFTDRLNYNLDSKVAVYPDTALLQNDRTKLSSLRGTYDVNASIATFVGEVIVLDEEFTLTSDSLQYNTDYDKAIFVSPTNIVQDGKDIYCESGYYDIPNGLAVFERNARFDDGEKNATADRIRYSEKEKTTTLTGRAVYADKDKKATADEIIYEEDSKNILLKGNAFFDDGKTVATGDEIYYNEETEEVAIEGEALLESEESTISSKDLEYDEATGVGLFKEDVVYINKEDSLSVYSDVLQVNNKENSFIAYGEDRPYMLRFISGDSLYLSADTLLVGERIDTTFMRPDSVKITGALDSLKAPIDTLVASIDTMVTDEIKDSTLSPIDTLKRIGKIERIDTVNIFEAYRDVRILSEEFQAIADSLYYDSKDSLFVLFDGPRMWSDSMQFTGDTIKIRLGDEGIDKVYLYGNGLILELVQDNYYNQLKAKRIEAKIDSSKIKFMEMEQNAESNYFILDGDDAFVGLNHTLCGRMDFYFESGELSDIKFYQQATSLMTPIQQIGQDQLYLSGFDWNMEVKPKTLQDLLKPKAVPRPDPEDAEGKEEGEPTEEEESGIQEGEQKIEAENKKPIENKKSTKKGN